MNNYEKEYYNLNEISSIVNLTYRHLHNRFKKVQEKYKNNKELIFKKSNRWNINKSIVNELKRKRNPIEYKLFTTIGSEFDFEYEYWKIVIKKLNDEIINKLDKYVRIKYVIETTERGLYHLHFMITFNDEVKLNELINNNIYINDNGMNILTKFVWEVDGLHRYFRKENRPVLFKSIF